MNESGHPPNAPWRLGSPRWLILALVCSLPLASLTAIAYRASLESSIWTDEVYSLVLASHPAHVQWELSKGDTNPPGFSILLRSWSEMLSLLGLPTSILTARSLGIVAWLVLLLVVAVRSRTLGGRRLATMAVVVLSANGMLATISKDVRVYALLSVGVLLCAYMFHELAWRPRSSKSARTMLRCLGLGGTIAFLTVGHLLAPVAVACVLLAWVGVYGLSGWLDRSKMAVALVACTLGAVASLSWLRFVPDQVAFLSSSRVEWMTEPTARNLFNVCLCRVASLRQTTQHGRIRSARGGFALLAAPLGSGDLARMAAEHPGRCCQPFRCERCVCDLSICFVDVVACPLEDCRCLSWPAIPDNHGCDGRCRAGLPGNGWQSYQSAATCGTSHVVVPTADLWSLWPGRCTSARTHERNSDRHSGRSREACFAFSLPAAAVLSPRVLWSRGGSKYRSALPAGSRTGHRDRLESVEVHRLCA